MSAAPAGGANGVQAHLENIIGRLNKMECNVENLVQHGCPTGRTEAKSFERGLDELRKDINELFARLRGVEQKQHYWGGCLAVLVVATTVVSRMF